MTAISLGHGLGLVSQPEACPLGSQEHVSCQQLGQKQHHLVPQPPYWTVLKLRQMWRCAGLTPAKILSPDQPLPTVHVFLAGEEAWSRCPAVSNPSSTGAMGGYLSAP